MRPSWKLLGFALSWGVLDASPSPAQVPFHKGISIDALVDHGLPSPASLARDPNTGIVYASSLYDANGSGEKTDIYRVLPDGSFGTFTAPIRDPDVLCLDDQGQVYVGSWPGRVTRIDPSTGQQTIWVHDNALGNIDGLAFDGNGDLLVSAIDHSILHKIDGQTQAISPFADLTQLGFSGFGSIAIHGDGSVFVATPKDGDLVKLASDGTLLDPAFRTGFLHMGQLAIDGDLLFASDNPRGVILRIDLLTDMDSEFVYEIPELGGGFCAGGEGTYYGSWLAEDMTDGGVFRVASYELSMATPPHVGGSWELDVDSPADALRQQFTFIGIATGEIPLPDGRSIPANLTPHTYVFFAGAFDATGHWDLDLALPDNDALGGLTVYVNSLSLDNGFMGISRFLPVTILD